MIFPMTYWQLWTWWSCCFLILSLMGCVLWTGKSLKVYKLLTPPMEMQCLGAECPQKRSVGVSNIKPAGQMWSVEALYLDSLFLSCCSCFFWCSGWKEDSEGKESYGGRDKPRRSERGGQWKEACSYHVGHSFSSSASAKASLTHHLSAAEL